MYQFSLLTHLQFAVCRQVDLLGSLSIWIMSDRTSVFKAVVKEKDFSVNWCVSTLYTQTGSWKKRLQSHRCTTAKCRRLVTISRCNTQATICFLDNKWLSSAPLLRGKCISSWKISSTLWFSIDHQTWQSSVALEIMGKKTVHSFHSCSFFEVGNRLANFEYLPDISISNLIVPFVFGIGLIISTALRSNDVEFLTIVILGGVQHGQGLEQMIGGDERSRKIRFP